MLRNELAKELASKKQMVNPTKALTKHMVEHAVAQKMALSVGRLKSSKDTPLIQKKKVDKQIEESPEPA